MTDFTLRPAPIEMHADTTSKRFIAWIIDVVLVGILTAIAIPMTFFIGALFAPALYAILSFLYRWVTMANGSATLGMRIMAVSIRHLDGRPLDNGTAFLHVVGYFVTIVVFPLQLFSIALMLMTERKQSLTDHILGTAGFNGAARY